MGKIFWFSCAVVGIMAWHHTGFAQSIDIPLFFDEAEESTSSQQTVQSQPKTDTPNIGRKAIPINTLNIVPPPLPPVTVDLSDMEIPKTDDSQQNTQPVNTRHEKISLPKIQTPSITQPEKQTDPESETETHVPTQDARGFDIEGIDLGMNLTTAIQDLIQRGYIPQKQKHSFPLYRTTEYETLCKQMGYHVGSEIRKCMQQLGKNEQTTYISEVILKKPNSRESITLYATSNENSNVIWKIVYQNLGDNSLNFTRQNTAKKLARKEAFFNAVFNKYGYPDDEKKLIWGDTQDAYMQVYMGGSNYDASITLTDLELFDNADMDANEWKEEHIPPEHFGFED